MIISLIERRFLKYFIIKIGSFCETNVNYIKEIFRKISNLKKSDVLNKKTR